MSKKLWHHTNGALLAGCLMATAAHAQVAPITSATEPANVPATTGAPVPQQVAPPAKAFSTLGLDLQFSDITVKELLKTLGGQFGINISVDDSVDGIISYINLTNSTPLEALQTVIATRRDLSLTQMPNGNYIVSKVRPGEMAMGIGLGAGVTAMPNYLPGTMQAQPISPGIGTPDNSMFNLPGLAGGRNNAAPFGQGVMGQNALPQIGQQAMNNPLLTDLPDLVTVNNRKGSIRQKAFRIKYAPSAFIAYQLDPANNRMPNQLQAAQLNNAGYNRGTGVVNALSGNNEGFGLGSGLGAFGQNDFTNSRANPYLQNSASSLVRPEVRANSQFGGNRGQQGGGFGGQQGGGGFGGQQGGQNGAGGNFSLPEGIEQVISVDPQNVLLVAYEDGNDEAVRQLQDLIDVLDQPLRQVEIEAQFVELQSQDVSAFGIDFSTSRGNFDAATTGLASAPVQGAFQVGFVRNNFTARLNTLIADNKAKVITAPRVTAINNLTAQLQSQEVRSLILTSTQANIGGAVGQQQNLLQISTTTGLTVTPTINGDDTITVLMQPRVESQDGTTGLGTRTIRTLLTVANVRDGDTIALGGLKVVRNTTQNFKVPLLAEIPIIGGLFKSRTITENESELIIFLTARIVRRAGDDLALIVPGT